MSTIWWTMTEENTDLGMKSPEEVREEKTHSKDAYKYICIGRKKFILHILVLIKYMYADLLNNINLY